MSNESYYTARKKIVFGKITKARNTQWDIISEMQANGKDLIAEYKPEYDCAVNLYKCYDSLLNTRITSSRDLENLEWIFNNGSLRSEEELKERQEWISKDGYGDSDEFYTRVDNSIQKENSRISMGLYVELFLIPIIPFFIALFGMPYGVATKNEVIVFAFTMDCLLVFSAAIHMLIFKSFDLIDRINGFTERRRLYQMTNKKMEFPKELAVDAATYLMFVGLMFKNLK